MSGGSYDYAFVKIDDLAGEVSARARSSPTSERALRMAFADLLGKVATAAKALEWCDSNDTSWEDAEPVLRSLVSPQDELRAAIGEAIEARDTLKEALERAADAAQGEGNG